MKIAVIPARGGSKRIPRKNIKPFRGKPMIAWSIEAARAAHLFDHVIVSTEDREIAEVAARCGAEVPFARPVELSDDYTGTTAIIAHATGWAQREGWALTAVCCISATAPFLMPADVERGLQGLESGAWDYAFAATEFAAPILRAFRTTPGGGVEMFFPEHFPTRSQDLPVALHDAGLFYWGRPAAWAERRRIFSDRSLPIVVPRWRVQDIDTEEDWTRAELLAPAIMERSTA
jgi:pseudaminic acid cytidylyltransferase